MSWTKIEDSVPENDNPVLVVTEKKRICIGFYSADFQKWFDYESHKRNEYFTSFQRDAVTHWTALPELPQESEVSE